MTRSLVVALALLTGVANAAPTNEAALSFEAARSLYHEKADIFRADDARVAHAQHASDAAKWLGGPKVELAFKQIWGTKTVDLDTEGFPDIQLGQSLGQVVSNLPLPAQQAIAGIANQIRDLNIHFKTDIDGPRLSLDAMWPIYTGGLIEAEKGLLRHRVDETRAERDDRVNTMDVRLVSQYWSVQLARSIEALRQSVLADQEAELKKAKRFEAKGLISKLERMSVNVARDTAHRELIQAQTQRSVAETELARSLRQEEVPPLSTPLFILTGNLGTLSEWLDRAQRYSPVLQRLNALRAQADEGVKAAGAAFKPKVFAFGSKNFIKHYLSLPEPDWIAGIGVTFTLWSDRDRLEKMRSAQSMVTSADAARSEAINQINTAVEVAFLKVNQMRDEYLLTASNVELARENLRLREKAFSEGLSTATDVDTARSKLLAAELSRRVAAYQFVVSWAMLHATSGTMPDFLNTLTRPDFVALNR